MTTHGDAAARDTLMREEVKHKADLVPSIYRLAGVAQPLCRVDGKDRSGPLSLGHTLVLCATSKVTKEDPRFSTD
jgi:arylsulfatase A-like enzyme